MARRWASHLRREARFAWGRAWPLRSRFIPRSVVSEAEAYLRRRQEEMIFVLGSGRSGTQLISELLDQSGEAKVFHEPNFLEDVGTMDALRRDESLAERYWREFRNVAVYHRWLAAPEGACYGEVNGTIRYQAPVIRRLYPGAGMFLMVRDGRGVVRSVMGWSRFYGKGARGAYALEPLPDDPFHDEWPHMSRFERLCWSWRDTNEFLMQWIPESHRLRLEDITSDYDYFVSHFSRHVGIRIPYEKWRERVGRRSRNATQSYQFPAWPEWSEEQRRSFVRICGPTMTKLGYVIE